MVLEVAQKWKKRPISVKVVLKWLLATFAILTADISNENNCALDKILRNFEEGHFWKILMVFVIFEFEICALMHLFFTTTVVFE